MSSYFINAEKRRIKRIDEQAWLQGMYIYEALCDAYPLYHTFAKEGTKAIPYLEEPYTTRQEKLEKEKEEQEKQFASAYMEQMMLAGKNWGKKKVPSD